MNLIVGWGNYVVLGCPKVAAKYLPPAYRGSPLSVAAPAVFTLTEAQHVLASRLVSEVSPLLRLSLAPDATAGRGGGVFLQALAEVERLSYGVERGRTNTKVLKDKPPPLHLRPPAWGRRVVGGLRLEPRLPKAP